MSNQFLKLRRSAVPGRVPSTSSIDFGEIALNTFDGLAFIKRSGSNGEEVITLGSREGAFTGSFSGSFVGNGAGLFNVPASGIVGLNLSQIATGSVSASVGIGAASFNVVSASNSLLYVSSSGNVGVNTTSPTAKIHISGSGTDSLFRIQSPFDYNGVIQSNIVNVNGRGEVGIGSTPLNQIPLYVYRSGYGELLRLGSDANTIGFSNGEIYIGSAANTKFSPGELRLLNNAGNAIIRNSYSGPSSGISLIAPGNIILTPGTYDGSGNVGVNINNPTAKLHVSGSTGGLFEIDSNTAQNILYVSSSGNVGIGSNAINSAFRLGVAGDVVVSGTAPYIAFNNSTTSGSTPGYIQYIISSNTLDVYSSGIVSIVSNNAGATRIIGGNTLIGTTANDAINRLQVSGSSRFIGNMVINGSGNTNATNALTVVNSNGTGSLIVRNDGQIQVRSTGASNPGYSFIDNTDTGLYMIGTGMYNVVDSVITVAYGSNGIAFNASGSTNSETSANLQLTKTGVGHRLSIWLNNNNDFHFEAWENSVGYANNIILNGYGGAVILGATTSTGEKLQVTGTTSLKGNAVVTGSLTVTGTLTAQTIIAQTITSSTDYVSGSTIFGNSLSNTHQFTGSVSITGSLSLPYLSTGSVLFVGNGGSISQNNSNFFWDNANGRLGIGTNAPTEALHVPGQVRIGTTVNGYLFNSNTITTYGNIFWGIQADRSFQITDHTYASTYLRINRSTGNTSFGSSADSGNRLQVYGTTFLSGSVTGSDMLIRGSGNTSATNALTIQNSSAANIVAVKNNRTTNIISDSGQLNIASSADATNGIIEADVNSSNTQTVFIQLTRGTVGFASTAINQTAVRINGGFVPTSGTATWNSLHINSQINQTGGANGITRGLYVNPTLTSIADFRAIEWSNNASGSTSWGLYGAGSAPNYLSGSLGINTTTPAYKLDVNGDARINNTTQFIFDTSRLQISTTGISGFYGNNFINWASSTSYTLQRQGGLVGIRINSTDNVSIGATTDSGHKLQVYGNTFVSGTLDILDAEINYQRNNNVTTGSARLIASIPTASLNAAFFDYVIVSGSNARAGTVMSVWASSSVEWNETYTNDIGSTTDVSLYAAITGSSIGLFATSSINNIWTIKSLIRTI